MTMVKCTTEISAVECIFAYKVHVYFAFAYCHLHIKGGGGAYLRWGTEVLMYIYGIQDLGLGKDAGVTDYFYYLP